MKTCINVLVMGLMLLSIISLQMRLNAYRREEIKWLKSQIMEVTK